MSKPEKFTREWLEEYQRRLAPLIQSVTPAGVGFIHFSFGYGDGGNLAWISNSEREDALASIVEYLDHTTATDPKLMARVMERARVRRMGAEGS